MLRDLVSFNLSEMNIAANKYRMCVKSRIECEVIEARRMHVYQEYVLQ